MNKQYHIITVPGFESLSGQTRLSCLQHIKPYIDAALGVSCPIVDDGSIAGLKLPSPDGTFERSTIYLYMGYNGGQALSTSEGIVGRMYKDGVHGTEFPQYQCYVGPSSSGTSSNIFYFNPTQDFTIVIDTTFCESAGLYAVSYRANSIQNRTFPMFCVVDMQNMLTDGLETVCIHFNYYYSNGNLNCDFSFFDGNVSRHLSKGYRQSAYAGRSFYPCEKLSCDRFITDKVLVLGVYDNTIGNYFSSAELLQDVFFKDGMIIDGKHYCGSLFAYGDNSAPHILCLKE